MGYFDNDNEESYTPLDKTTDALHYGRVCGLAFLRRAAKAKDFLTASTWDDYTGPTPTVPISDEWVVVNEIRGDYVPDFPTEEGYGAATKVVTNGLHTINVTGIYHKKNHNFLNSLIGKPVPGLAFVSGGEAGDLQVVQNANITAIPNNGFGEELSMYRKFTMEITFNRLGLVPIVDVTQEVKDLFF